MHANVQHRRQRGGEVCVGLGKVDRIERERTDAAPDGPLGRVGPGRAVPRVVRLRRDGAIGVTRLRSTVRSVVGRVGPKWIERCLLWARDIK
eukprot:6200040-Pleurochrysis_carterae.AAC.2